MKVDSWPIDKIVPYARNPREISASAVAKVAGSIAEFDWQQPIVVDDKGVVIVGHTRLEAARQLGHKKVPVTVVKDWPEAKKRAYRIADNRVNQDTGWDIGLLAGELHELNGEGFDLGLLGFEDLELEALMAEPGAQGLTDPDDAPEAPDTPVTRLGDVWACGRHRVLCGDSTSADDVGKLLAGVTPLLMVTDPPYGVEYDPAWRKVRGVGGEGTAVGKVTNDDNHDWSEAWGLFPGDVIYVWCASLFLPAVAKGLEGCGFIMRSLIVWSKSNFAIGRGDYQWKHEPCWYAVRKNRKGHYCGGRKQTTVWEIDKPMKSETGHSTQKPVECMRRPIVNNSTPGQPVYDPFLGSGTTMIAAEMEARACYGLEIDPGYCDVIVNRWQNFTGEKATLESDGRSFEDTAKDR